MARLVIFFSLTTGGSEGSKLKKFADSPLFEKKEVWEHLFWSAEEGIFTIAVFQLSLFWPLPLFICFPGQLLDMLPSKWKMPLLTSNIRIPVWLAYGSPIP